MITRMPPEVARRVEITVLVRIPRSRRLAKEPPRGGSVSWSTSRIAWVRTPWMQLTMRSQGESMRIAEKAIKRSAEELVKVTMMVMRL